MKYMPKDEADKYIKLFVNTYKDCRTKFDNVYSLPTDHKWTDFYYIGGNLISHCTECLQKIRLYYSYNDSNKDLKWMNHNRTSGNVEKCSLVRMRMALE